MVTENNTRTASQRTKQLIEGFYLIFSRRNHLHQPQTWFLHIVCQEIKLYCTVQSCKLRNLFRICCRSQKTPFQVGQLSDNRCHLFLNRFKLLFACLPEINGITGIVQAEERDEFQCFALCRINLSVIAESNPAILFFLKRFADWIWISYQHRDFLQRNLFAMSDMSATAVIGI